MELRSDGTPLNELLWAHAPAPGPPPQTPADWQPTTPESVALSKLLKRRGFRFVGPTTVYAAMQACGVVNDHLATCHVRAAVERERAAAATAPAAG